MVVVGSSADQMIDRSHEKDGRLVVAVWRSRSAYKPSESSWSKDDGPLRLLSMGCIPLMAPPFARLKISSVWIASSSRRIGLWPSQTMSYQHLPLNVQTMLHYYSKLTAHFHGVCASVLRIFGPNVRGICMSWRKLGKHPCHGRLPILMHFVVWTTN